MADVRITMERTPCFGTCPAYRVQIEGTGATVLEGLDYVDSIGIHETRISVDDVVALLNGFLDAHFLEAGSEYVERTFAGLRDDNTIGFGIATVSDGSTTILTLQLGSYRRSFRLYEQYPRDLGELADRIDEVVDTKRFIAATGE